jgi:hypothetical protein
MIRPTSQASPSWALPVRDASRPPLRAPMVVARARPSRWANASQWVPTSMVTSVRGPRSGRKTSMGASVGKRGGRTMPSSLRRSPLPRWSSRIPNADALWMARSSRMTLASSQAIFSGSSNQTKRGCVARFRAKARPGTAFRRASFWACSTTMMMLFWPWWAMAASTSRRTQPLLVAPSDKKSTKWLCALMAAPSLGSSAPLPRRSVSSIHGRMPNCPSRSATSLTRQACQSALLCERNADATVLIWSPPCPCSTR